MSIFPALRIPLAVALCIGLPAQLNAQPSVVLSSGLQTHLATLQPVVGERVKALEGNVVVVSFFASWCPPCREEFKALNALAEEFSASPLAIVAVNAFEAFDENDAARMMRFLDETTPRFPIVKATEETLRLFGGVNRIPTVFVFDGAGRPIMYFKHARGAAKRSVGAGELRAAIAPAVESLVE